MRGFGRPRQEALPHGFQWHGWKTVAVVVGIAVLAAAAISEDRYLMSIALIGLGLAALAMSLVHNDDEMREQLRETPGPGCGSAGSSRRLPAHGPLRAPQSRDHGARAVRALRGE